MNKQTRLVIMWIDETNLPRAWASGISDNLEDIILKSTHEIQEYCKNRKMLYGENKNITDFKMIIEEA